jgi:hypothetical protein
LELHVTSGRLHSSSTVDSAKKGKRRSLRKMPGRYQNEVRLRFPPVSWTPGTVLPAYSNHQIGCGTVTARETLPIGSEK